MPIKFRCDKCRQFLGISRSLAGKVVDCPTCGRSTRVPELDGTRAPIPEQPAIPKGDSSLLNALDQLADLGKPTSSSKGQSEQSAVKTVEPVVLEPVKVGGPIDPPDRPAESGGVKNLSSAATPKPTPKANPQILAELAAVEPVEAIRLDRSPRFRAGMILGAMLGGLVLFGAGWILHGLDQPAPESGQIDEVNVGSGEPTAAMPASVKKPRKGIYGRITYRRPESACLPDRGSRIVIWKVGYTPTDRWSAGGFRPGDSEQATDLAAILLKEAGGAMAITDDDGYFEVDLPSGGDYEILILSRFGGQGIDEEGLTAAEKARLEPSFQEPQRVVGKTQFTILRMKYKGEGAHLLDHVFEVIN